MINHICPRWKKILGPPLLPESTKVWLRPVFTPFRKVRIAPFRNVRIHSFWLPARRERLLLWVYPR